MFCCMVYSVKKNNGMILNHTETYIIVDQINVSFNKNAFSGS